MRKETKTYLIQGCLFVVTIFTTTLAGMQWMGLGEFTWENFAEGFWFSMPFLGILTVHEFGHYIASRIYKLAVTLPYYLPMFIPGLLSIGTLGAFIRIKSPLYTRRVIFDVGIAGPLAGFVVALGVIFYGFTHLPEREDIFRIHPEYKKYGEHYDQKVYTYQFARYSDSLAFEEEKRNPSALTRAFENIGLIDSNWREQRFKAQEQYAEYSMGKNLLFTFFEEYVATNEKLVPNRFEMFHYPFLFAGYLALFFTALNLIPIGQLDGGHVVYGLFGARRHTYISVTAFIVFVYLAGVGIFHENLVGNVFGSVENLFYFAPLYFYFLYFIFSRVSNEKKNNLLIAACVFAAQFFTEFFFPSFQGFNGWFLFAILIGRFLGVHHPPALYEEPLNTPRIILGWISFVIFIISFTPNIIVVETFTP